MIFSVLHRLKRWDDIIRLCPDKDHHLRYFGLWKIRALAARGDVDDAVNLADRLTEDRWAYRDYTREAERILRECGRNDEAYTRYALPRSVEGTYLAHYRRLKKDYPSYNPERILDDLLSAHPEKPGAWFAAIRREGFLDRAADLARNYPVNPNTLLKAAEDTRESHPDFALDVASSAIRWIIEGYGYDMGAPEAAAAWMLLRGIAEPLGRLPEWREKIRLTISGNKNAEAVMRLIGD